MFTLPNATLLQSLGQIEPSTQSSTFLVVGMLLLIFLSFSVSGSQAAVFSLSDKDLDILKTKQQPSARRIINLLEEPKELYTSMLISKTILNICLIILTNYLINLYTPPTYLHTWYAIVGKWLAIAFLILFPLEIFPRVWARQNSLRFAYEWPILIVVVEIIHLVFRRISKGIVSVADEMGKSFGTDLAEETSLQQFDEAIDIQPDEEASQEEKNIMKSIVKFGKISVRKVMKSRLYVSGIDYNTPFGALIQKIEELHFSRLPVYKENLDEIEGIINIKDLVPHLQNPDFDWHGVIRPPFFVPDSKLIEDLLIEFQNKHLHFAIVVDEFGGTSGIVTLEDILEEVIGDIKDEFDEDEELSKKLDDNTYIFEGSTMLHDVCKTLQIPVNTFDKVRGDNESLGGLINEISGDLPQANSILVSGDFEFTVLDMERNRVKQVKVVIQAKV
ncbi:MAG TPA: gliding motility-associated protein GldE [Niabella sp.]|nr:gliding motility-associated protein GldE [Niabella sp.]HOZ97970.1 gliding motility-associated protein GldE [Niabella sp.]HQW14145.1 gliding motility-associated protein GldE [Niabella sp.]HQX19544.1 gliding motility-associated protein GldE [Niabella sp.]HQX40021.1 gliding motility-associated protein GldE [Niabella sp.]